MADPLSDKAGQLGNTDEQPLCAVLRGAVAPGRINRRVSVVICFLRFRGGSACVLAISDPTDVGISSALPLALASSVIPVLCPLTRLTVRPARARGPGGAGSFSMFCTVDWMV